MSGEIGWRGREHVASDLANCAVGHRVGCVRGDRPTFGRTPQHSILLGGIESIGGPEFPAEHRY